MNYVSVVFYVMYVNTYEYVCVCVCEYMRQIPVLSRSCRVSIVCMRAVFVCVCVCACVLCVSNFAQNLHYFEQKK